MKKLNKWVGMLAIAAMAFSVQSCEENPPVDPPVVNDKPGVELNVAALWDGQPLTFLSGWFEQPSPQKEYVQFFNFGMIVSKLRLVKEDDTEVMLGDGYQWIDFKKQRTKFKYEVPVGKYKALRFTLGLDSAINHGDPNQWGAEHPLNGNLTGMHWGWAGGYIFQAIDGNYKDSLTDKYTKGMSLHTATDVMVRNFEVPVGAVLGAATLEVKDKAITPVQVNYHVNRFLKGIELKKNSVSHSEGVKEAAFMQQLLGNLKLYSAFEIPAP
ncbi:MAG: MbnP family protein [Bacteroidota bacterium]